MNLGSNTVTLQINKRTIKKRSKWRNFTQLYLFLLPAMTIVFLFQYLPMLSNVVAFLEYDMFNGWMGLSSPFVGFKNFNFFNQEWFYSLAFRTIFYNVSVLLISFPFSIILALMINELKDLHFKKVIQTISYMPRFVSWVTVGGIIYIFLSLEPEGLINNILVDWFGQEKILFMHEPAYFLPLMLISQIWKDTGWGSILYLASMATINPELYEAAKVDGAGRWKQLLHITLPCIMPTTFILLIFNMAGLFAGNFDQIFNLQNAIIRDDTNVITTFVYYKGIVERDFGVAAAIGLFQGIVSFIFIMSSNYLSKKVSGNSIV